MISDLERKRYFESLNALGLPRDKDPFPFDPPDEVDYWADNKEILEKMVKIQMDSAMFASSFFYALFGPVGGGKTFAVKYLANQKTKTLILKNLRPEFESLNIRVAAIVPVRTGQLTFSLHKEIVEKLFLAISQNEELIAVFLKTKTLGRGKIKIAFNNIKKAIPRTLYGKLNIAKIEESEGYKFLTQARSRLGKLVDVNELVETIAVLLRILSEKYERVFISLDELENLRRATGTERLLCSDFLRKMHETVEHNLTLFLIFTLESFDEVGELFQKAFLSRVKEVIEFSLIKDKSYIKEYITECIAQRCRVKPYDIIHEEVVDEISDSLTANFPTGISFRQINREMHKIFIDTYIGANQQEYKIDSTIYEKTVKKAITPKEVVKQMTEELTKNGDE